MGGQGILEVVFGELNGYPGCQLSTPALKSSPDGVNWDPSIKDTPDPATKLGTRKNSRRIPWLTQNLYQQGDLTLNLIVS